MRILFSISVLLLVILVSFQLYIYGKVERYSENVRPAIKDVLYASYRSKVTGDYWENELEDKVVFVKANNTLSERLDFYTALILLVDLDSSRATVFIESVGSDSFILAEHLKSKVLALGSLSKDEKVNASFWQEQMRIISQRTTNPGQPSK